MHGKIKVYTVAGFSLLYQLASQDTVVGVAFSSDARRLYDIRGYYGNGWEPSALAAFADQSSKDSGSQSEVERLAQSSSAPDSTVLRIDQITALAASPLGDLYCCGTDKGVVSMSGTQRGKLVEVYTSKGIFSIEQMVWSGDGRYLPGPSPTLARKSSCFPSQSPRTTQDQHRKRLQRSH